MGLLQNLFMQIKPIENGQKQFLAGTRSKAKGEKKMRKQIDDNTKPNLRSHLSLREQIYVQS